MSTTVNHPAVKLGNWLKSMRQAKGFVKRVFAEKINLSASKYTELEAGVVAWLETKHETAIAAVLELADATLEEFNKLLSEARAGTRLTFSDIFTREQLTPVRSRLSQDRAIEAIERDIILDAIFKPLA